MAAGDPYAWTESEYGLFAGGGGAFALVKGCSPARALNVLGAGRATPVAPAREVRDWAQEQDYRQPWTAVEAGEISGWTIVVELGGYQATVPELLEKMSHGGEAVVIHQDVNAHCSFQYAKNGIIVRAFDPLVPDMDQTGEPLPEEQGIEFPGENGELHPMSGAFLLAERLTGVRLTEDDLLEPGDRIAVGVPLLWR